MTEALAPPPPPTFFVSLLAGGMAGTSVDVTLFPIDTVKTRLQAPAGFWRAGGFRGIYNGLSSVLIGSAPGAALFFTVYEYMKVVTADHLLLTSPDQKPLSHLVSASVAEVAACLVRVPTEVVKAQMQTATMHPQGSRRMGLVSTVKSVWQERHGPMNSVWGGLYRGFGMTLLREIPFSMVQFPLYEYLKEEVGVYQGGTACTPWQAAMCGSAAGGVAAALTTPLDVVKTRLMLGKDSYGQPYKNAYDVCAKLWHYEGGWSFWRGLQPRVFWITLGGFVFFGSYEESKKLLQQSSFL